MRIEEEVLINIQKDAYELAMSAGKLLQGYFRDPMSEAEVLKVSYKDAKKRDPVTAADKEVQKYLSDKIKAKYPTHGIVGEEGDSSSDSLPDIVWVLDPLDGTRNFMHGFPCYASSIGIMFKGLPIAGAIFIPWPNQDPGIVIHASNGNGCMVNDKQLETPSLEDVDPNAIITLPGSFSGRFKFDGQFISKAGEPRMGGSIAYEMSLVALGITEYAVISGSHLWDVLAGIVLVNESGATSLIQNTRNSYKSDTGVWSKFENIIEPWESGVTKVSDIRAGISPLLLAQNGVAKTVASNIQLKQNPIKKIAKSIFSQNIIRT
ncbi:MAG: inositol monophosphatase [Chloroflexota bacterium]|nr:inositol monophosphatase [Chloroflexota bacterium]MEC9366794.1 inositol monophosphatase [Chloroflexota bacterium]